MTSPSKRRDHDLLKLMMSGYEVTMGAGDQAGDFYVMFPGPKDSPYEGGRWKVHVVLPAEYPYKSPSIGFTNTLYHPNVDEASGSVCLDVINQTWSPMFELKNIFDSFLPQLLLYPNASDPLNGDAAALYLRDKKAYRTKVQSYIKMYASCTQKGRANSTTRSEGSRSSGSGESTVTENDDLSDSDQEFSDLDLSDPDDDYSDEECAGPMDL